MEAEIRRATVLLVHPQDRDCDAVTNAIKRVGCRIETAWPAPALPPIGFDFALVALDTETLGAAVWLSGEPPVPIVGIVDGDKAVAVDVLRLSNVQAIVVKPCQPAAILANLVLARNIFAYERRLLGKVSKLEETLHASRQIEQAKMIVMNLRKINAHEAYDYLRRQAMAKQISVAAISAALVDSHGLMD